MLWRRLDNPGHEWARLSGTASAPVLRGTSIFIEEGISGRLDYRIRCDSRWESLSADVVGWAGEERIKLSLERTPEGVWRMNGQSVPGVGGCVDIDLAFSPSTNLLPIRRLDLEIGREAEVRAAWLTFPDLEMRPLVQWFRRESAFRYAYSSDTGFSTELEVDGDGMVVDYPPLWTREKG